MKLSSPSRGTRSLVVVLLAHATLASASDGVLEINQTCATATRCLAQDGPGFPATISEPGSDRLTSQLDVQNANSTAVEIQTAGVTLDLNGFSITGIRFWEGLVIGNIVFANGGKGLNLNGVVGFADNAVSGHTPEVDGGVNLRSNLCGFDASCP